MDHKTHLIGPKPYSLPHKTSSEAHRSRSVAHWRQSMIHKTHSMAHGTLCMAYKTQSMSHKTRCWANKNVLSPTKHIVRLWLTKHSLWPIQHCLCLQDTPATLPKSFKTVEAVSRRLPITFKSYENQRGAPSLVKNARRTAKHIFKPDSVRECARGRYLARAPHA